MSTLIEQIQQLSKVEKIQLVQQVWDDIAQDPQSAPAVPLLVQQEVLRSSAVIHANPKTSSTLQDIAQRLGVKL
jgi:putative addiction module component (TIGR02574 family)